MLARWTSPLYAVALFASAALLFLTELTFSKQVLPLLGGTPAVWNTCMLFFQTMLLAGYGYAHFIKNRLPLYWQTEGHFLLLAISLFTLPITIGRDVAPPPDSSPIVWLLLFMLRTVGPVIFLLSATSPLLQSWFARAGHVSSVDPYFLYAASNLGSMLAVVGYPFIVEPFWPLSEQSRAWAIAYTLFAILVAVVGKIARNRATAADATLASRPDNPMLAPEPAPPPVTNRQRATWLVLAAIPSSMVLGLTTYLSTDVASFPLLWVVPLAIYLLTFVLTFAKRRLFPHRLVLWLQMYIVMVWLIWDVASLPAPVWGRFTLHLLLLFSAAMVCHGELVRRRPHAAHLTEFYMWLAVGGVVGAAFNAIVAPTLFANVYEYPLALLAAMFARPHYGRTRRWSRWLDFGIPLAIGGLFTAAQLNIWTRPRLSETVGAIVVAVILIAALFAGWKRPLRFGLTVSAVLLSWVIAVAWRSPLVLRDRTFFGVYTITDNPSTNFRMLWHGTTIHGGQLLPGAESNLEPLTYYHRPGPLGQLFRARSETDSAAKIGIVGLGTGSTSCYAEPEQSWTYFEIDPLVERIARSPKYFTMLESCAPKARVVLGDARISLRNEPDGAYDLLVIDAFSSDAIPVHLLTREALALYLRKLNDSGEVAIHISNRYLDLEPVVAALAKDAGLTAKVQSWSRTDGRLSSLLYAATWVVISRRPEDVGDLFDDPRWEELRGREDVGPWTDDFSNIPRVLRWTRRLRA